MEAIESGYRVQCLECGCTMTWKRYKDRRSHFAHLAGSHCSTPAPESELHKFGKHVLCTLINAGIDVKMVPACILHNNAPTVLSASTVTAKQEVVFINARNERRVLDVGCFDKLSGMLVIGVEIWHSHKSEEGSQDGLSLWFELKTDDICLDRKDETAMPTFLYYNCATCELSKKEKEKGQWEAYWHTSQQRQADATLTKKNICDAAHRERTVASWKRLHRAQYERQQDIQRASKLSECVVNDDYWTKAGDEMYQKKVSNGGVGCLYFDSGLRSFGF